MDNREKILEKLEEVAGELESDMLDSGWVGKTVTLKYKIENYQGTPLLLYSSLLTCANLVFTRAKAFTSWVTKKEELFAVGEAEFQCFIVTQPDPGWQGVAPTRTPPQDTVDRLASDETEGFARTCSD